MKVDFIKAPISAAIRTDRDFSAALRSQVDMVFLLHASINTVRPCVKEIHSAGKKAFIHVDFAEGIGKDRAGLEFLKKQGVDGILTTRTGIVTKKIKAFSKVVDMPIIAGGIVETLDEVRAALEAGATVVSTGEVDLWDKKVY